MGGIEVDNGEASGGWRLSKLDELPLYLGSATRFKALVSRDQRLITLPVVLATRQRTVKLTPRDAAKISQWLD